MANEGYTSRIRGHPSWAIINHATPQSRISTAPPANRTTRDPRPSRSETRSRSPGACSPPPTSSSRPGASTRPRWTPPSRRRSPAPARARPPRRLSASPDATTGSTTAPARRPPARNPARGLIRVRRSGRRSRTSPARTCAPIPAARTRSPSSWTACGTTAPGRAARPTGSCPGTASAGSRRPPSAPHWAATRCPGWTWSWRSSRPAGARTSTSASSPPPGAASPFPGVAAHYKSRRITAGLAAGTSAGPGLRARTCRPDRSAGPARCPRPRRGARGCERRRPRCRAARPRPAADRWRR